MLLYSYLDYTHLLSFSHCQSPKNHKAKVVKKSAVALEQQERQNAPSAQRSCQMNPVVKKMKKRKRMSLQKKKKVKMR